MSKNKHDINEIARKIKYATSSIKVIKQNPLKMTTGKFLLPELGISVGGSYVDLRFNNFPIPEPEYIVEAIQKYLSQINNDIIALAEADLKKWTEILKQETENKENIKDDINETKPKRNWLSRIFCLNRDIDGELK